MQDNLGHARGWFLKAESDIATARRLLESEGLTILHAFTLSRRSKNFLRAF
jgi:hypothetical protein